jgi:hypothetical protein
MVRHLRASRTHGLLLTTAAATLLTVGMVTPALAAGVVGDPQPELAQFTVGSTGGLGTGTVVAGGQLVLASPSKSGTTIGVCVLRPGARACTHRITLHAHAGDTFSGTTEVFSYGTEVTVVALDCCTIGSNGVVEYVSTDGGATFIGPLEAGNLASIGAGTQVGAQVVVATYSQLGGTGVQAFSLSQGTPVTSSATLAAAFDDGNTALSTDNGGVLVASDDTTNTHVEFAKSGSDFNATAAYKSVGTFPNELVSAASGNALLTDPGGSLTGGERLRFFNSATNKFGPGHKVPDTREGDDGYFTMQDVHGTVHVFFEGRRYGYDVFTETTRDGVHWTPLVQFGSAIVSSSLSPVLGPTGAGLLFENDGTPLRAQPILNRQSVHITLSAHRVKAGHTVTLHGQAEPHLAGLVVTLEYLRAGRWYPMKTGHESAAGTFATSVPGVTRTYRAVLNQRPGYYEYGYSNAVTLVAVP